ncbi:MAG: hypothetical protein QG574_2880 [Cyanobacteriota bacterium erpe_2018_sw_21hr_WHONDRS-SW48-000092_B_bin.40]|jgi:hypothetical protein|nr:hypothetical protein [Cyanobacteriota bacterium erpe_2018_sw_21hr_WHONDRS-SW48-000092_B_bin.40]
MKKKIPSIILFFVGVSFFFVANYLSTSEQESGAIAALTNIIFGAGGCITIVLSVIMFFNTKDDDDIESG